MFAHQGGWDEILYALGPIVLIFGLLRLASSRAKRANAEKAAQTAAEEAAERDSEKDAEKSAESNSPARD